MILNYLNNFKMNKANEDLGKVFEKSICLLYDTEFIGNYKYSLENAIKLKDKIYNFKYIYPYNLKHIANKNNRYDFINDNDNYLSAKTTKKDGKICPQKIGQTTRKKFCEYLELEYKNVEEIKEYIINNISFLLEKYFETTFDCSIIYYNQYKNLLLFIKKIENINWNIYDIKFSHINKNKSWNESSSISINNINIGEFQIHKNRDCIKFRWYLEKMLKLFDYIFEIIEIPLL